MAGYSSSLNGFEGQERPPGLPESIRKIDGRWFGDASFLFESVNVSLIYFCVHELTGQGVYPEEAHPFIELFYTLSGRGMVACEGKLEECLPGSVFIVRPGQRHSASWSASSRRPWSGILFHFNFGLSELRTLPVQDFSIAQGISPFYQYFFTCRRNLLALGPDACQAVEQAAAHLLCDLRKHPYFAKTSIVGFWLKLIMLVSEYLVHSGMATGKGLIIEVPRREQALEKAKTLLEDVANRAMDIRSVARAVGMSRSHFMRSFRQAYGIPPQQHRRRSFMEHAGRLLVQTDMQIGEIALELGFADAAGFSKAFHQYARIPPLAFRQRNALPGLVVGTGGQLFETSGHSQKKPL